MWRAKLAGHKILLNLSYEQNNLRKGIQILEPASCVVHVFCGFMTECLKVTRKFSLYFENIMKTHLSGLLYLLDDRPPSIFPFYLCVYFFTIHFIKSKLMERSIPALNLPKTYINPFSRYIYATLSFLL